MLCLYQYQFTNACEYVDNCLIAYLHESSFIYQYHPEHLPEPSTVSNLYRCEHDPNLATVIAQVDRICSKSISVIDQNEIKINIAAEQSAISQSKNFC